jgi:glycosyltransferase involved in cell wall biosynthesis
MYAMSAKISVFIISYNQKNYLNEAIESVLNQTLKPFEILIVDDCSTDGSQEVIESYVKAYPSLIKAFYQEKNLGIAKNKAFAQKQVKGEWLTYLDGDDRFLPRKLEMEYETLQEHLGTNIVFSNFYLINSNGERLKLWADRSQPPSGYIFPQVFSRSFPRRTLFRNELISSECLKKVGFYDEERITHEDWDFKIRLTKYFRAAYCPVPLSEYRLHEQGISKSLSNAFLLKQMIEVYEKNCVLLDDLEPEQKDFIREDLFKLFAIRADRIIRETNDEGEKGKAFQYYKEFKQWLPFPIALKNACYKVLPLNLRNILRHLNKLIKA